MKTPDEIKKGLECCTTGNYLSCRKCPYEQDGCGEDENLKDALAYIQQLERERDAAVRDMTELMQLGMFCSYCKHLADDGECTKDYNGIDTKNLGKPGGWWCWQWRGVQEVE